MLKARDQYKEAASVYFRISGEVMPNLDILVDDNPYFLFWRGLFFRSLSIQQ